MPTIYDNIETKLLAGLQDALKVAARADFCVGYFNLRGWRGIAPQIDALPKQGEGPACRLIVGMGGGEQQIVRQSYYGGEAEPTNKIVNARKKEFARHLAQQLTFGAPSAADEAGLRQLEGQLRSGRLQVKFFGAHRLHAKLYLVHRDDKLNPIAGYVGSSNLTLSGLERQGELNVDVLDKDAAAKLARWFDARWQDRWCLDIGAELADIIRQSWAGGPVKPYEIYIKSAYELSRDAIAGTHDFMVPAVFQNEMLEFQKQAVALAAQRLERGHRGVIIGDVVGLGKTMVASAVVKTFQEDHGHNVLVVCPPKLEGMWNDYLYKYVIAGRTLSLGKVHELKDLKHYRLVIIDESHNLRNRDSRRYAQVHDYIRENGCHVVLLTATPYNKEFADIASQLRLFVEPDADLGIRPDQYIKECGGEGEYKAKHPNLACNSLAAFEQSEYADDWRDLMRMFMVRRTRSHIKKNYAEYDAARKQHFLTFSGGARFYFPERKARRVLFGMDESAGRDQYAQLYSPDVVDTIGGLNLTRYGLHEYLLADYQEQDSPAFAQLSGAEKRVIRNLSRAGSRLVGFAKSNLFKRLESSGPAFLSSIARHILRNAVYLAALQGAGELPIGGTISADWDEENADGDEAAELFNVQKLQRGAMGDYSARGEQIYARLSNPAGGEYARFQWISGAYFQREELQRLLLQDCEALLGVLARAPEWKAAQDRKLQALIKLCNKTHADEKLLVFTQYKDTADYLHRELKAAGAQSIAEVHGNQDNVQEIVRRFSPLSNDAPRKGLDELRVLITTDTLSEGQNLQDARIVVNFDLPWALIRMVQRAGRVDRIGQRAEEVLCYSFLPEKGVEKIISLRGRLQQRIQQGGAVIGSDEVFFEGDKVDLHRVYEETLSLEEEDDETDLISRAYDIWRQAIKQDPTLETRIKNLPDVVYSAKRINAAASAAAKQDGAQPGALAYMKTNRGNHVLVQLDAQGEVLSQSQAKILRLLACEAAEPLAQPAANHHQLVKAGADYVRRLQGGVGGGQLGGPRSIRRRAYDKLQNHWRQRKGTLLARTDDAEATEAAIGQIYNHPLTEAAQLQLKRALRAGASAESLHALVLTLFQAGALCNVPQAGEAVETQIICSMGLVQ